MVEGPITIVEDANTIAELLWVGKEREGLLLGSICLLEIILHKITVTQSAPDFAVLFLEAKDPLKELDGLRNRTDKMIGSQIEINRSKRSRRLQGPRKERVSKINEPWDNFP